MSNLAVFGFEGQEIRFVDGKPVANDVAKVLGYADPAKTVSTKVKDKNKSVTKTVTVDGKSRDITVLEEAGIYQLIFGSKLPSAEKFQDWVFEEVLPAIRKTGQYVAGQQAPLKDIKWQKRLVLFLEKSVIPYDYFCIFTEATCGLISQFESLGYVLPEDATIDISIGQHWANFLRTQVDDIEKYRQKYPHYYPDSRGMKEANMYKLDLLPMFRRWMETDYKMRHLENYLKTKDKQAIYILADLMGIQFLPGMFENKKMIG